MTDESYSRMEAEQAAPLEVAGDASVKGERERRIVGLNAVTFVIVLALNGLAGSGKLTGTSIGAVSNDFPTYITPAGFAFSIWGVIYTCMALFVLYGFSSQARASARLFPRGGEGVGLAFAASNVLNVLWIVLFTQNKTAFVWASSAFIFALLAALLVVYVRCGCWTHAFDYKQRGWPAIAELVGLDIGFSLYSGWVSVACIINIAAPGGNGGSALAGAAAQEGWSCTMLAIAALINTAVVLRRHDPVFPLVLAWACNAIRTQHYASSVTTASTSVAIFGLLLSATAIALRVRCASRKAQQ